MSSAAKRQERQQQLDALPVSYLESCTEEDNKILDLSLRELVQRHEAGTLSRSAILEAYGKKVVSAQKATNCIAAVTLRPSTISRPPESPTRSDAKLATHERTNLLAGVPVSIKDCIDIEGYDTTMGYSSRVNKPASSSASIVRLLQDAGAIIHAKTATPPGLVALETCSDLFGRTSNPYNAKFVSGASTGGGAALLASRGSLIEISSDIGGSVRWPAHCCGIYGMRSTIGRFPTLGVWPPLPGQEFVGTSTSPMARRLDDLEEFWKRVVEMRPWNYDHTVSSGLLVKRHDPITGAHGSVFHYHGGQLIFRAKNYDGGSYGTTVGSSRSSLSSGVIYLFLVGIVPPSPACRRALEWVTDSLVKEGHEVVNLWVFRRHPFPRTDTDVETFPAHHHLL